MKTVGSRVEVFHGTAKHTAGGLTKSDLQKNKQGHIVSKRQSASAKRNKNLGSYQAGPIKLEVFRSGRGLLPSDLMAPINAITGAKRVISRIPKPIRKAILGFGGKSR